MWNKVDRYPNDLSCMRKQNVNNLNRTVKDEW